MRPMFLTALAVTVCASSCSKDPRRSEESLVGAAYSAIAHDDRERYRDLVITPADLMLRANRGPFGDDLTYEGSVLRPEELEQHRLRFDQARRGGPGLMDFSADRLDRSRLVARGERELLSGEMVEVAVYAADLKRGTEPAGPLFQLVRWGSEFRILALRFPPGQDTPLEP